MGNAVTHGLIPPAQVNSQYSAMHSGELVWTEDFPTHRVPTDQQGVPYVFRRVSPWPFTEHSVSQQSRTVQPEIYSG